MSKEPFLVPTIIDERLPLLATLCNDEFAEEHVFPPQLRQQNWKKTACFTALCLLLATVFAVLIRDLIDIDNLDLGKTLKLALYGGLSGAAATFFSVLTLMPLRTVMNYQYRYGATTSEAICSLYADGGLTRYYHGLVAALIQGPLVRFGDTAANIGVLTLFQTVIYLEDFPALFKTVFASLVAAGFRTILTPVDTIKTLMQTRGSKGLPILHQRIKRYGFGTLWSGAFATAAAGFVGHYPWFGTYNYLELCLPEAHTLVEKLLRNAFIGFVASVVSDSVSNSLRVVKTYCQVNETRIDYFDAVRAVIGTDGVKGLLGRGLKTRILANGLQGLIFSVLWKFFQDFWNDEMGLH